MGNKIIIPTGYMGSGSSAVTDLVSEFDGFDINNGSYEYVFMHCPNGVFDLEDKLLQGNTALRSDEAIHSFLRCMEKLYHKGYWFSNYQEKLSPLFLEHCRKFIQALDPTIMTDVGWYYQENIDTFQKRCEWFVRRIAARITHKKKLGGRPIKPLTYYDVTFAYPTKEEFHSAAKQLLSDLFTDCGYAQHHLVLDQMLLPHNLHRIDDYFDENLRVFVIARDPRDVYISNKYFWLKNSVEVPFPTNPEDFCKVYAGMRQCERLTDDPRIMRLHFEDLIYRYDATLQRIYPFLDITEQQHVERKGSIFKPENSIHNTQLFLREEFNTEEIRIIEKNLPEYLYTFPVNRCSDWSNSKVF